jgi:hypothetical protein
VEIFKAFTILSREISMSAQDIPSHAHPIPELFKIPDPAFKAGGVVDGSGGRDDADQITMPETGGNAGRGHGG